MALDIVRGKRSHRIHHPPNIDKMCKSKSVHTKTKIVDVLWSYSELKTLSCCDESSLSTLRFPRMYNHNLEIRMNFPILDAIPELRKEHLRLLDSPSHDLG